jgi:hypothetical protein
VTVLDSRHGQKTEQYSLLSDSDVSSPEEVQVQSRGQYPVLAWADKGCKNLKINVLGGKTITTVPITKEPQSDLPLSILIHASNDLAAPPHFLIEHKSSLGHWGDIIHVEPKSANEVDPSKATVKKIYEAVRLAGPGTYAPSLTADNKLYFTRVAKGAFVVLDSAKNDIVASDPMQDFGARGVLDFPDPLFSVGEISPRAGGKSFAVRTATLIASGDISLIANGRPLWSRREGLAYVVDATFADLPKTQSLAEELAIEEHSSVVSAYAHRLTRHLKDLEKLPAYLQSLPDKLIASILGKTETTKDHLFGFNKYIVLFTSKRRVMAIDAVNGGRVVWSTLDPRWTSEGTPELSVSSSGVVHVKFPSEESFFNVTNGFMLLNGGESELPSLEEDAQSVKYAVENNNVVGKQSGSTIWTFTPPPAFSILNLVTKPEVDPVASIGDVLGDRRVLYKYLNPNALLITSVSSSTNEAQLTLIDAVSGNTLWSTTHASVDTSQAIPSLLTDNALIYSFTSYPTANSQVRGHQLVSARLYESDSPDDRGVLGSAGNYSALAPGAATAPYVVAQAYLISEAISHFSVSRTRQGITTRQVLAVLPASGSLMAIPFPLLNPRRPVGRDPLKTELEEGLFPYAPALEFDSTFMLSHRREVLGLSNVLTEPATLESTSLVFAYGDGGDVFGTRISPSGSFDVLGKEFNKGQLIVTVIGTWLAAMFLAPIVGRKASNLRWEVL